MIIPAFPSFSELSERADSPVFAVVFCAESYNALAVIRALGRRGVPVLALGQEADSIGFRSRFATEKAVYPDPVVDEAGFVARVSELGARLATRGVRAVTFPSSDRVVRILSDHRESLGKYFQLFLPSRESVAACLDKLAQYRVAAEIGVPFPRTYSNGQEDELLADLAAERARLPLFFKSRGPLPDHELNRRFRRVVLSEREQVATMLREAGECGVLFVVQEIIPGADDQLYTLGATMDGNGGVLAAFTGRKLRQMPPGFGICRVGETVDTPAVLDHGERLLRALEFRGISQVEFKFDVRDGEFKLMEVNPRSWSWVGLPIALGCDLPYAALCAALGFSLTGKVSTPSGKALWISLSHDLDYSVSCRDGRPWAHLFRGYDRVVEAYHASDDRGPGIAHFRTTALDFAARSVRKLGKLVGITARKTTPP